ncbi:MAG: glycosyltransferase [Balneolaceae bacterium]
MNIRLFYHSLLSDWNHGNAHFLRGITSELLKRGHDVEVYEPRNGWSYSNWIRENGRQGVEEFKKTYPLLDSGFYDDSTDFSALLKDADLVIVHEWTSAELIKHLGDLAKKHPFRLLFHDTHHRSASSPEDIEKMDFSGYDGVLAFGQVVREIYIRNQWVKQAWVWHEAADTSVFKPVAGAGSEGDLVWIGNWGGDERTDELMEFLIRPVQKLGLKARMYGVLYPEEARDLLKKAGIDYGGYLPSCRVPEVLSGFKCTVHIPRKTYTQSLPGIPTIRPFEAMACGIPMISAPWKDTENLFRADRDFKMVQNGEEMTRTIEELLQNPGMASSMAQNGLETIQKHHTCSHRVDELMEIYSSLSAEPEQVHTNSLSN